MEVQIRLAKKTDEQSVLEMSKGIYQGHDYFPHVFLKWFDDPDRNIIVAEKENTVIGLRAFHVVDGGKTVVSQSLRVHPKYRGQGLSTALIQATRQYIQRHYPHVEIERYTTMSSNVERLAIQRREGSDSLVLELGIVAFYVGSTNPEATSGGGSPWFHFKQSTIDLSKAKPLTPDEFHDLLEDGRLDSVVRKNTLIVDWEPFKVDSTNVCNGLVNDGDCMFVSNSTDTNVIESLSHGRQSPRVNCLHWVATIYTWDIRLLKIHITKQLECATSQINKPFIFSSFLPTSLISCAKDFLSKEFSLKYVDFFNFNLMLFEKAVLL